MERWYDLYINDQWSEQYHLKNDAVESARAIFNENPDTCRSVEVVKCTSYDFRDGGDTVYKRTRTIKEEEK